ncbi:MAG: hypothetical protein JRI41_03280 [Deltaproteobacteria bacterium]|nr:hypothetical protein [Deltaproteobacteria bacterium]
MISSESCTSDYVLRNDSKEWEILQSYIPVNKSWLRYISDNSYIRYEDYYLDFDKTIQRIADFISVSSLRGFEKPVRNKKRMYWSNNYHLFLDEEVFSTLVKEFYPFISQYWPEKLKSLRF